MRTPPQGLHILSCNQLLYISPLSWSSQLFPGYGDLNKTNIPPDICLSPSTINFLFVIAALATILLEQEKQIYFTQWQLENVSSHFSWINFPWTKLKKLWKYLLYEDFKTFHFLILNFQSQSNIYRKLEPCLLTYFKMFWIHWINQWEAICVAFIKTYMAL